MMEINIHSREQEFYRISSDDIALTQIGLGSYTISSLNNLLTGNNGRPPVDIVEFFAGETNLFSKLLGIDDQSNMKISEFDISSKKYVDVTGFSNIATLSTFKYNTQNFTPPPKNILLFLRGWNDVQRGVITAKNIVDGYRAVVYKIQNSKEQCISFKTNIKILRTIVRNCLIKIHFLESIDPASSRSISFKGSPIITDMGQTPYNSYYSFRGTSDAPAGQFTGIAEGGISNPNNTVSAPMDLAFDPSTSKWQSGTHQMLMRLLDDVEPAIVPELTPEELLSTERVEYYETGEDSQARIRFTKGRAIPMSSENGNVHLFGPDYKDGCAGKDQVILTVINKMNIAYKAGSVVVCSKMLGDGGLWTIIAGIGSEGSKAQKKIVFGNFEFQQHVIPMNHYFTDPLTAQPIKPDVWALKIRLDYYVKLLSATAELWGGLDEQTFKDIVNLNFAAASLTQGEENPIDALRTLYNPKPDMNEIIQQSKIGNIPALDFINIHFCSDSSAQSTIYSTIIPKDEHIKRFALPKNVLKRTACLPVTNQLVNLPTVLFGSCDNDWGPGVDTVPVFWGMLFPDGYRIDTVRKFDALIKKDNPIGIFKDDPNLRELTCGATECSYDLQVPNNQVKNLLFAKFLGLNNPSGNLSLVRTTGGLYRNLAGLQRVINSPIALYNHVSMNITNNEVFSTDRLKNPTTTIYGAEPVNPGKIQFSSMSLETLYMASDINEGSPGTVAAGPFYHLYSAIKSGLIANLKYNYDATFKEYANYLIWNKAIDNSAVTSSNPADSKNTYNIKALSVSQAGGDNQAILNRHTAPLAVLLGAAAGIVPQIGSSNRLVTMPVLTCKSTITTNAGSLLFTLNQSFGAIKKRTASAGQGPSVEFFPLGAGVGWSTPGTDPKQYGFTQWGGDNDIDSFGTTALHVRVFEHVPSNQLIYIGPIFTPLHFSASEPALQYEIETSAGGVSVLALSKDSKGQFIPSTSPNDFKIPTNKSGGIFPLNSVVTKENLAPNDEWKNITVRRAKLLTKGGFAYFKNVIVISGITVKKGGRNYKPGDKLALADGSELLINGVKSEEIEGVTVNGIIDPGLIQFTPNFVGNVTKSPTRGLTSLPYAPAGGSGSGAEFNVTYTIKYDIGLDLEPAESTSSQGNILTSPNARGEEYINSERTTTIDLVSRGNNKKYDIFYFYHNDPSHYSLDGGLVYSNAAAQYVISEVKAQ